MLHNANSFVIMCVFTDEVKSFYPCGFAYNRISHEYSSLFIIVINLIFMFSL